MKRAVAEPSRRRRRAS